MVNKMRIRSGAARAVATILLATLGVAGAGLLAGCGGGGGSASNSSARSAPGAAAGPQYGSATNGLSNSTESGSGSTTSAKAADVADTSDLIITAGLQLAAQHPEQAAAHAEQVVTSAGGYVAAVTEGPGAQVLPSANTAADTAESTDTGVSPMTLPTPSAAPGSDQALLLLRVAPSHLGSVLAALAGTGQVSYRTQSETDVTGQVADVNSRIASAQDSLTELRGLIDKAASMNDLISLEQALASRESDLESLETQQRALADQTRYATVTVGYFQPAASALAPKPAAHHTGFVAALDDGWHALAATVRVLLVALGWLLPFALVLALLWWPVRRLRRLIAGGAAVTEPHGAHTWWRWRPGHRTE